MKPSIANGLTARVTGAVIGVSLAMAAASTFAAPPLRPADGSPVPQPVAPYGVPYGLPLTDPSVGHRQRTGQARMTQERTDDQYILIIDLNGLAAENVQVRPFGQTLLVRTRQDARTRRSETFNDGRGYRESYRVSTGSSTRRLPVPPDGDLFGLAREDSAGQVRILIPRRKAPSWR